LRTHEFCRDTRHGLVVSRRDQCRAGARPGRVGQFQLLFVHGHGSCRSRSAVARDSGGNQCRCLVDKSLSVLLPPIRLQFRLFAGHERVDTVSRPVRHQRWTDLRHQQRIAHQPIFQIAVSLRRALVRRRAIPPRLNCETVNNTFEDDDSFRDFSRDFLIFHIARFLNGLGVQDSASFAAFPRFPRRAKRNDEYTHRLRISESLSQQSAGNAANPLPRAERENRLGKLTE
jgi:hypothetical protein